MTDNEIIKALEICVNNGDCKECAINPHKGNYGYCTSLAIKQSLDLINRQKAEIESNKAKIKISAECIARQDKEIERLSVLAKLGNMRANDYRAMRDKAKTARTEAVKEFAERLKLKVDIDLCEAIECSDYLYNLPKLIDNLVKEMVGETNEQK